MKQFELKILSYLLAVVMLLGMIPTVAIEAIAEELTDTKTEEYVLEFASEEALSAYLAEHGGERLGANMLLVSEESAKHVHSHSEILSITKGDAVFNAAGVVTDTPDSSLMTSLNNQTGLESGLRALEAYLNDGQSEMHTVKVAILDTGIDGTHPDLAGRVVAGYDAINDSAIAAGTNSDASTTGHGTKVAGILGALWGNQTGIDGSAGAFPIEIIPVRVLDENGKGTLASVIRGINWAVDNGADIINLSFSATLDYIPTALETATLRAESKGILVLAAQGNDGDGYYVEQHYPADLKGVMPVTARVKNSSYSYYETPDWANGIYDYYFLYGLAYNAPGSVYATTAKGGGYTTFQGTSACTAYVGGFAAALYSVFGTGESRRLETVKYVLTEAHKYNEYDMYFYPGSVTSLTIREAAQMAHATTGTLEVNQFYDADKVKFTYTLPNKSVIDYTHTVVFGYTYYDAEYNEIPVFLGYGEKMNEGKVYDLIINYADLPRDRDYSTLYAISLSEADMLDGDVEADPQLWFEETFNGNFISGYPNATYGFYLENNPLIFVNIPGSTVSFYDTFDSLIKQKNTYYDGVVSEWFVYLTREERDTLRLGYSDEGTVFLPHRIYDGETVDLLYITENMLFNVTADKSETQSFGGADALHTVTLDATDDNVVLANADVYVETPFDYKKIGTTDESGSFTFYATSGEYTLWISDNDTGYMLRKTVSIENADATVDLAADIASAAVLNVTTRSEGTLGYTVFVSEGGRAGVFSGIVPNDKPIHLTPGTYSVDFALIFQNDAEYVDDVLYHGVNVHLSDALAVSGTVEKTVDYSAFTYTLDFEHRLEMPYCYYEELEIVVEGRDANGYVINRLLNFDKVSVGDIEYDNVGEQIVYAGLLPLSAPWCSFELVDKADPTLSYILVSYGNSLLLDDNSIFSETEQRSFTVTFRPAYEPDEYDNSLGLINPTVFAGLSASTTITLAPMEEDKSFTEEKIFRVSEEGFWEYGNEVFYLDENGQMVLLDWSWPDNYFEYTLPEDFAEGDKIVLVIETSEGMDYNIVEYDDTYATTPYCFQPHTTFSTLLLKMKNEAGEVESFAHELTLKIEVDGEIYPISAPGYDYLYYDPGLLDSDYVYNIPSGTYDIDFGYNVTDSDEEGNDIFSIYMLSDTVTLNNSCISKEYSMENLKHFSVESKLSPKFFDLMEYSAENYFSLHYADGSVIRYGEWPCGSAIYNFYVSEMPTGISGELCFYGYDEMTRFSPKTVYAQNTVVDGGRYTFGFTPEKISATLAEDVFTVGDDVLINLEITDSFNNAIASLWTAMNKGNVTEGGEMPMSAEGIHTPIIARPYPFEGKHTDDTDTSTLIDHLYPVTVYYRAVGASEWSTLSTTDYSVATISGLGTGDYEYYVELDFDTYSEEYLIEYPSKCEVYTNVSQIFNGKLATEVSTFSVVDDHDHVYGDYIPDSESDGRHYRECECGEKEYGDCDWDDGEVSREPTHLEEGEMTYTCTVCGAEKTEAIDKTAEHSFGEWKPLDTTEDQHYRECECGEKEYGDCVWNGGETVKQATHFDEGEIKYTCTVCGREKTETVDKTDEHVFGEWKPLEKTEDRHYRECACGEGDGYEEGDCVWDDGEIIEQATHLKQGQIKYTCTLCGREKTEVIPTGDGHTFGDPIPDPDSDGRHYRECECGEKEYENCTWDNGEITKEPTHFEVGERKHKCLLCGREKTEAIDKTDEHVFGEWKPLETVENGHYRECACGEGYEEGKCEWDNGEVVKKATHLEEGEIKYTCTLCGREKTEAIDKTDEHVFGEWKPLVKIEDGHYRECACGEGDGYEEGKCEWDNGEVVKKATHLEEGEIKYTCTLCGREKTEKIETTDDHSFGEWKPSAEAKGMHYRVCACGESESANCAWDNGVVTEESSHTKEGVKTYTCAECKDTRTEKIDKTDAHEFGEWQPLVKIEDGHYRECACGEGDEEAECTWDNGTTENGVTLYICTLCGREKREAASGEENVAIILLNGGAADGEETLTVKIENGKIVYKLPAADKFNAPEGYGFAGWKLEGEDFIYSAESEIFADAEHLSTFVLVAQWAEIVGEGSREFEEGKAYIIDLDQFMIEGEDTIYFGGQVVYVDKKVTCVIKKTEYKGDNAQ